MVIVICPKCKSDNINPVHWNKEGKGFTCGDCDGEFNANEMIFCHDYELEDNR